MHAKLHYTVKRLQICSVLITDPGWLSHEHGKTSAIAIFSIQRRIFFEVRSVISETPGIFQIVDRCDPVHDLVAWIVSQILPTSISPTVFVKKVIELHCAAVKYHGTDIRNLTE